MKLENILEFMVNMASTSKQADFNRFTATTGFIDEIEELNEIELTHANLEELFKFNRLYLNYISKNLLPGQKSFLNMYLTDYGINYTKYLQNKLNFNEHSFSNNTNNTNNNVNENSNDEPFTAPINYSKHKLDNDLSEEESARKIPRLEESQVLCTYEQNGFLDYTKSILAKNMLNETTSGVDWKIDEELDGSEEDLRFSRSKRKTTCYRVCLDIKISIPNEVYLKKRDECVSFTKENLKASTKYRTYLAEYITLLYYMKSGFQFNCKKVGARCGQGLSTYLECSKVEINKCEAKAVVKIDLENFEAWMLRSIVDHNHLPQNFT